MAFGRQDIRVDTDINLIAHRAYDENGVVIPSAVDTPIKILNLSTTGLMIQCEKEFSENTSFYVEMKVQGEDIEFMPVIVRKTKQGENTWIYGCKLMQLDNREEQLLRKCIFDLQLKEKRKKELEKMSMQKIEKKLEKNNEEENKEKSSEKKESYYSRMDD